MIKRRNFIKKSIIGTAGITIGGIGFSSKSYASIFGSSQHKNTGNLFFVNRIDCEDEALINTPLERLVPKFIDMKNRGFAMPTLLIRCAGKKPDGVTSSPSSMKAVKILREHGSPIGIHVHTKNNEHGGKIYADYINPQKIRVLIEEACNRFKNNFGIDPVILGMGDVACSTEEVAKLLSLFGIELNLADLMSPKYSINDGIKIFDYRPPAWRTDFPIYKHNVWWIPIGTDGIEAGVQNGGFLGMLQCHGQNEETYKKIFSRYKEIGKSNPNKLVIIGALTHPPETLSRWYLWEAMHRIARENGFKNITSIEALDMLKTPR